MAALPPPRVLVVSRRTVRKNKFVDFVGEYHLDLIVKYGAVPIIVPRINGLDTLLDGFEPIHGVLLCEGEDIDPSLYSNDGTSTLTDEDVDEINKLHSSDICIDKDRDSIEMQLTKRCLDRSIPFLGICRGCQVLNVACKGTLYKDVEKEIKHKGGFVVKHIDYDDYDEYRHPITVIKDTPLHMWFKESLELHDMRLNVNSYHHQGIKHLSPRFKPMAFSPCGLVEGFYDPFSFNPNDGKYIVGLQFHPERMRKDCKNQEGSQDTDFESLFDYPGCPHVYKDFITSVIAYQRKTLSFTTRKDNTSLASSVILMGNYINLPQIDINSKPSYAIPSNVKLNGFKHTQMDCMIKHKNGFKLNGFNILPSQVNMQSLACLSHYH